ncbi:MAG: type II toxin-antitoxin system VapC family toxin [Deltaproteobacteria bacterium]|nr:type II toxin-antitoxin system VapC family toxin [Deltaproteobacteria bacterium]
MTPHFVLDASAALRLFLADGPVPDGVEHALTAATKGSALVLVPALFHTEVLHVVLRLERRGIIDAPTGDALLADLRALPVMTVPHGAALDRAADLARHHGLSGYGATYLALARHHAATLLTADAALAAAARA